MSWWAAVARANWVLKLETSKKRNCDLNRKARQQEKVVGQINEGSSDHRWLRLDFHWASDYYMANIKEKTINNVLEWVITVWLIFLIPTLTRDWSFPLSDWAVRLVIKILVNFISHHFPGSGLLKKWWGCFDETVSFGHVRNLDQNTFDNGQKRQNTRSQWALVQQITI